MGRLRRWIRGTIKPDAVETDSISTDNAAITESGEEVLSVSSFTGGHGYDETLIKKGDGVDNHLTRLLFDDGSAAYDGSVNDDMQAVFIGRYHSETGESAEVLKFGAGGDVKLESEIENSRLVMEVQNSTSVLNNGFEVKTSGSTPSNKLGRLQISSGEDTATISIPNTELVRFLDPDGGGTATRLRFRSVGNKNWEFKNENGLLKFYDYNNDNTPLQLNEFNQVDMTGANKVRGAFQQASPVQTGDISNKQIMFDPQNDRLVINPQGGPPQYINTDGAL